MPRSAEQKYEPYGIEVPDGIEPDEVGTLTKVEESNDGWYVYMGSWGFFIPCLPVKVYGKTLREAPIPVAGDRVEQFGGLGRPIQGIRLNGVVVFYRTDEQQDTYNRRWREDLHARRQREFALKKSEMDADYEKLDPLFQRRIDRFRREGGEEFRVESESYEVFCLLEAQKFADWSGDNLELLTAESYAEEGGDRFSGFNKMWEDLEKRGVASRAHSNNTFGGAVAMAKQLIKHRAGEEGCV